MTLPSFAHFKEMNEKVLRTLEYDKVLAIVASHARTDSGRDRVLGLAPSFDEQMVNALLDRTDSALKIIAHSASYPIKSFRDIYI